MKYKNYGETIPQEQRKGINDKIEYIVNQGLTEEQTGISKEDIFNAYTGKGGLHGLQYNNYGSYYDYQLAKSEIEQGQFFTPYPLVEWIYDCLHVEEEDLVADLTSGHGAFAAYCPNEANFYGCELDVQPFNVSKYLYPNAHFENTDIRFYDPGVMFDYVVGNPPYNLRWDVDRKCYLSEFYYCLKAADLLKPAGILVVIVPMSFCADDFSNKSMIEEINKRYNFICQIALDKNAFRHLGVENYKTKILFLQKKSESLKDISYSTEVLYDVSSAYVWSNFMQSITENRKNIKQQLFLEIMRNGKTDEEWNFKVQKLLYDIKRHPKTKMYYAECLAYLEQFKTQKKPDHINWDEWQKIKIMPDDVIKKLRETLRLQNGKKNQESRLIKRNYTIGYNKKVCSINDLVINEDDLPVYEKWAQRLIEKKQKEYELQSKKFADMVQDKNIAKWLNDFELHTDEETIRLNDTQKHDLNLFLQKRYCFIQWEQGSGKTLAGIAIGKYRLQHNNVKNVFVVSTAIAIKNNWAEVLEVYGINFRMIESIADIKKINSGEFVIITLNMMCKYHKQIRNYVKSICQKAVLIFDESDNISNMDSKRTKAVLSAFRKLKYKTLMTGTSTRNNISEIYPQLELLYNNSVNMLSECEYIKEVNRDGDLEENCNPYYRQSYPAYKSGLKLFTSSHIPEKITVFGVSQFTQDIHNADILKEMIDKTIITRTFEEVSGKDLYEIIQINCKMGLPERSVYKIAIEEFYKMDYMFKKTGNSRKDAMLKILNQLLTLLKICAAPQTLKEYAGGVPEKFKSVLDLVESHNERIAIGARHIKVVEAYAAAIRNRFPNRPIFVITGQEATLKQRRDVIKKLKRTENGILISTQQSLSASMNIDFVNVCIIPELHWNNSSMSQYYFRFIRYTSTEHKKVYFVTYENSIESNLLKMILVKDKLNLFMKNQDLTDDELYEKFGIDSSVLENLMYREKDENGKYVVRWGEQEVC